MFSGLVHLCGWPIIHRIFLGMTMDHSITGYITDIRKEHPKETYLMDDEDIIIFCLNFFRQNNEMVQEMDDETIWGF